MHNRENLRSCTRRYEHDAGLLTQLRGSRFARAETTAAPAAVRSRLGAPTSVICHHVPQQTRLRTHHHERPRTSTFARVTGKFALFGLAADAQLAGSTRMATSAITNSVPAAIYIHSRANRAASTPTVSPATTIPLDPLQVTGLLIRAASAAVSIPSSTSDSTTSRAEAH